MDDPYVIFSVCRLQHASFGLGGKQKEQRGLRAILFAPRKTAISLGSFNLMVGGHSRLQ
jgi:hypothetical protein